jgi:hypothetical protein
VLGQVVLDVGDDVARGDGDFPDARAAAACVEQR